MGYYFENPDKLTFKAIEFNNQLFAVGRGLFIHLMKYYPEMVEEQARTSKSKVPFTLKNFAEATRDYKEWFNGIRFKYIEVSKEYRTEIKAMSKVGEGWWPERKKLLVPGIDYDLTYSNFLMNYEGEGYHRRLGKGFGIPNEKRIEFQDGVEFTRKGYAKALEAYQKVVGSSVMFNILLPMNKFGWYHLRQISLLSPIPEIKPCDWIVWKIKNKEDRDKFITEMNEEKLIKGELK